MPEPTENGALARVQPPRRTNDIDLQTLGGIMAASGMFPDCRQAAQAIVKIQYGRELGIEPVASMLGIHFIQGKPSVGANIIAAKIKASGKYDYRIKRLDNDGCELEFRQGGELVGVATFGKADAQMAGLLSKDNYKKDPSSMFFARAISRGARRYCPDVFAGIPVFAPEDFGESVSAEITQSLQSLPPPAASTPPSRVAELKAKLNGGAQPAAKPYGRDDAWAEWVEAGRENDGEAFNAAYDKPEDEMTDADWRAVGDKATSATE